MKILIKSILTLVLTLFTVLLFAEGHVVKIDLRELDMGDIPKNFVFISVGSKAYRMNDTENITVSLKELPTYIGLRMIKKNRLHTQKLFWIETEENLRIKGTLEDEESLVAYPQANSQYQNIVEQLFLKGKKIEDDLKSSKPFLVYMVQTKKFLKKTDINKVVANLPDTLKNFWAAKYLNKYLKDLENVGYDPTEKKFSYLIAKDNNNKEQRIEISNGKYLLIDFSSAGCGWCIKGIDKLVDFEEKYKDKLDVVMLWEGFVYSDWINYKLAHPQNMKFRNLLDENGAIFSVADINTFPTYMLFNPEGYLVKQWKGRLPKNLSKYLKK